MNYTAPASIMSVRRHKHIGRGEGVISMLLKPLSTAIADGNPIRAVIKGVRVNHDGRTQGITMPSAEAQEDNIRKLYLSRDIHPDSIQYVEAHVCGSAIRMIEWV